MHGNCSILSKALRLGIKLGQNVSAITCALILIPILLPTPPLKAHILLEESTFDTRSQALAAAKYLNCKGVRKIDTRWKPCDRPFPQAHGIP